MKTVCCNCRKAKNSRGWSGKEVASLKGIVFGVCPDCYSLALAKIRANYDSGSDSNNLSRNRGTKH